MCPGYTTVSVGIHVLVGTLDTVVGIHNLNI